MSTQKRAFRPLGKNKTVNLAVTASNQYIAIPNTPLGTRSIRVVVIGTATVFMEHAESNTTSPATTTTSMPQMANTSEVYTISTDITHLAVIAAGTGSTVYLTYGEGL